jgi:hypothetical protein
LLVLAPILPFVALISYVRLFINEHFIWRDESAPRRVASRPTDGRPAERTA